MKRSLNKLNANAAKFAYNKCNHAETKSCVPSSLRFWFCVVASVIRKIMSLKEDALKLASALEDTVSNLELYGIKASSEYAQNAAKRLMPAVEAFNKAVKDDCSREKASEIIMDLEQLMNNINGAATKGDMEFDNKNALNRYWEYKTIFQESKYRGESL